jgi:iron(III) transport system permease protein
MWNKLWKGNNPEPMLVIIGAATAAFMALPIGFVIWRSMQAGADRWLSLLDYRIPFLLMNTLQITFTTTLFAIVIGVSLAWLVYRCDTPGRGIWQWLFALPLMLPPYVGAVSYIMVFGPAGWIRDVTGSVPFNIYSFWGTLLVLTLFKFPYVFLICGAAIRGMNRSYEDTARSLGLNNWELFWKVNFPFLRPAIGAGAILTALCVLSEFGVIAIMRYNTFTTAIFYQMESYDRLSASVLSMVLMVLTLLFLWLESLNRRKQKYYQTSGTYTPLDLIKLGKWKALSILWISLILFASVVLPIGILIYWSVYGLSQGALDSSFWNYTLNSIKVAGIAAIASMILALPLIYLKSRYPSVLSSLFYKLSTSGYALPGVVVALGLIYLINSYLPWLYNTFFVIAIAYLVRFLPQALQYGDASLILYHQGSMKQPGILVILP